jgi:LmbE family N-acetylglucosaminyl deacetylase
MVDWSSFYGEQMTKKQVLLAILAHPDDESFGPGATLARYAAEGVDVHICTLTDGAAGTTDPNCEDCLEGYKDLADRRLRELECAVEVLGGTLHFFGYRDSGMAGDPANEHPDAFVNQPLQEIAERLSHLMRQLQPDSILTHDDTGGYFHPDHVYAHQATLAAYHTTYPKGTEAPSLYCPVLPQTFIRAFAWIGRLTGQDPTKFGRNKDIDLTCIGKPPDQIHVRVDTRDYQSIKERASACHTSQGGGTALREGDGFGLRRWLISRLNRFFNRQELFQQLYPPPTGRRKSLLT